MKDEEERMKVEMVRRVLFIYLTFILSSSSLILYPSCILQVSGKYLASIWRNHNDEHDHYLNRQIKTRSRDHSSVPFPIVLGRGHPHDARSEMYRELTLLWGL